MADIIEFLEARIAEDEAAAVELAAADAAAADLEAPGAAAAAAELEARREVGGPGPGAGSPGRPVVRTGLDVSPFTAARVLAECAAKRKILANVPLVTDISSQMGGTSEYVLMCLASVYGWHPDYQEGWAVTG